jgi:hypothetical protein
MWKRVKKRLRFETWQAHVAATTTPMNAAPILRQQVKVVYTTQWARNERVVEMPH